MYSKRVNNCIIPFENLFILVLFLNKTRNFLLAFHFSYKSKQTQKLSYFQQNIVLKLGGFHFYQMNSYDIIIVDNCNKKLKIYENSYCTTNHSSNQQTTNSSTAPAQQPSADVYIIPDYSISRTHPQHLLGRDHLFMSLAC